MAKHPENSNEVDSTTDRVQRRRLMKHMVEKRRRNRINNCLENMRKLVLKAQNKNPENYTKMEKADILEMTTNFLLALNQQKEAANQRVSQSNLHRHQSGYASTNAYGYRLTQEQAISSLAQKVTNTPAMAQDYSQGYATCQAEIRNYLNNYAQSQVLTSPLCSPTQGLSQMNSNNMNALLNSRSVSNIQQYNKIGESGLKMDSYQTLDNSYMQSQQSSSRNENSIDIDVENVDNVSSTVTSGEMWRPW